MISEAYRRKIFWLCRIIGLQTEERRDVQEGITGKRSLSKMTSKEAVQVIQALSRIAIKNGCMPKTGQMTAEESVRKGFQKHDRKNEKSDKVYSLASKEQKDKIMAMSNQIYGSFNERRMDFFCLKQFKTTFRKLSNLHARELIEIQKEILSRKIGGKNDYSNKAI